MSVHVASDNSGGSARKLHGDARDDRGVVLAGAELADARFLAAGGELVSSYGSGGAALPGQPLLASTANTVAGLSHAARGGPAAPDAYGKHHVHRDLLVLGLLTHGIFAGSTSRWCVGPTLVDLWQGILFCDVLAADGQHTLCFVPLPLPHVEDKVFDRGSPWISRDIAIVNGVIKYIELDVHVV
ncbi:hypothetical protein D1007_03348 [Hordeum vulgare]|nr:hypothetical protein D1007_03348 [Hordeum vulgare]